MDGIEIAGWPVHVAIIMPKVMAAKINHYGIHEAVGMMSARELTELAQCFADSLDPYNYGVEAEEEEMVDEEPVLE